MNFVKTIESLPFYRLKTDEYVRETGNLNSPYSPDETYEYAKINNYAGLPVYGYADFQHKELLHNQNKIRALPNRFLANKKFQSQQNDYFLVPFRMNCAENYIEDIMASCNKNTGDVMDVLFVNQAGRIYEFWNYYFIRQWSINKEREIIVYELRPTSVEKILFKKHPRNKHETC